MSPTAKSSREFFDLGITAARLAENRKHYDYVKFRKISSQLELDVSLFEDARKANIFYLGRLMTSDADRNHSNYYHVGLYAGAMQIKWEWYNAKNPRILREYERKVEECSIEVGIPREITDTYLDTMLRPTHEGDKKRQRALCEFIQSIHNFLILEEPHSNLSSGEDDGGDDLFAQLAPTPPSFHEDVVRVLNSTIQETSICYRNECYLATVVLCGKIIETLVTNAYKIIYGEDPVHIRQKDGQKFDMKFDEICRSLMRRSPILVDSGLAHHMKGIYAARNAAVHGNIKIPTRDDAYVMAKFSRNIINRVFQYLNSDWRKDVNTT